jgi:NAD(P)H-dependent flavin oxidoreductase YrpB (nitropropane dioxygenase family)
MMRKTRLCELFGIELPIVFAGMGRVATAKLAAAVSQAGGFGTIGLAGFTAGGMQNEIDAARKHTTRFDIGWPDAPHRVLRTELVRRWEAAGRPEPGKRPGEGKLLGTIQRAGVELPMVNYSVLPPLAEMQADLGGFAWYAGQSCALTKEILPAGEIVRRIAAEAGAVIANRLAELI